MRLVDADALLNFFDDKYSEIAWDEQIIRRVIEKAPTIEQKDSRADRAIFDLMQQLHVTGVQQNTEWMQKLDGYQNDVLVSVKVTPYNWGVKYEEGKA